ncbi:hypothetical protein RHMOL_Rhmol07G0186000 [Rhododendron molle]|uniref:Uncharacterized protein n=1 Tax=Rhododendron molle TaxID=49168 RepID=A0ACC0N2D2_RHOML|nr:hypothetical protein RHMOL_Rhmol07G0186000 [Rhododendron molle]
MLLQRLVELKNLAKRSTHKPTTSKKGSKASSFCVDDWEEEEFDNFVSDEGEEEDVDGYKSNDGEDIGD